MHEGNSDEGSDGRQRQREDGEFSPEREAAARDKAKRKARALEAFAGQFWRTQHVLNWIAFRAPEAINLYFIDEIPLYSNANWSRFKDRRPGNTLLASLVVGAIKAIRRDGVELPALRWAHVADADMAHDRARDDHKKWEPYLRFRRDEVLTAFPSGAGGPDDAAVQVPSARYEQKPRGESKAFPGRPSLAAPILRRLKERSESGLAHAQMAAEARWLLAWARETYPDDRALPGNAKTVENIIRAEYRAAKYGSRAP